MPIHFYDARYTNIIFKNVLFLKDPQMHHGMRPDWVVYLLCQSAWHGFNRCCQKG